MAEVTAPDEQIDELDPTQEPQPATVQPPTPQGRVYIGPAISDARLAQIPQGARIQVETPDAITPQQQDALQAQIGAASRRRAVTAPDTTGVSEPGLNLSALNGVPIQQASQAIQAAVRYQGMRGYQQDLASGKSAAEALARNSPALFFSTSGTAGRGTTAMTGTRQMTPFQQAQVQRWQNPAAKVYAPTNLERLQKALVAAKASGDTQAAGQIESYIEKLSTRAPARVGATGADSVATVSVPVDAEDPNKGHVTRRVPASQVESIFNKVGVTNSPAAAAPVAAPASKSQTISIGAVRGGYRFKGGDPRKKENWEKVE